MSDLLVELGCEELPANCVAASAEQLAQGLTSRLSEAGLWQAASSATTWCTPRRVIVAISGLADSQADQTKDQRGPALAAAFGPDGTPTKALEGFCRSQGVSVDDLRQEGDYVWLTKVIPGRTAGEVLSELIPAAIRAMEFPKSMRWGAGRMRFARPIRWLLALLSGVVVPFEIEGVPSGNRSRGHRFMAPDEFEVTSCEQLISELRMRSVEPDASRRREMILKSVSQLAASSNGLVPDLDPDLVEENVFLTEWPMPVMGSFAEEIMRLPEPVLVTSMAKHQRFFPVRDSGGQLKNAFISVTNNGDPATVQAGNEWVINARFNDAQFFYDEDSARNLDDFLAETAKMTFQVGLGTVRQRADRLARLAGMIAKAAGGDAATVERARVAGRLAKADLSTGLVSEFASLQGVIGSIYASREGHAPEVCRAIRDQYAGPSAFELESASVYLAENLDKLAGFLGIGAEVSGSSDPYALRRAATTVLQVAGDAENSSFAAAVRDLSKWIEASAVGYREQQIDLTSDPLSAAGVLFESRMESLLGAEPRWAGRADLRLAAISGAVFEPALVRERLPVLWEIAQRPELVQAASRPFNILSAAEKKGIPIPTWSDQMRSRLATAAEQALILATDGLQVELEQETVVDDLQALTGPINAFFDAVMVMDENHDLRDARLALLGALRSKLSVVGDWGQIVLEG